MSRVQGFTPEQAVLGVARRLPPSVTSPGSLSSHALAESEGAEGDQFGHALLLRSAARKAFIEADNCSSLRRALLRRGRPMRDPYKIGDWVLYWRRKGGNMKRERGRWYGPARVVMAEGNKIIWLTHANKLIRASPEQLRPASHREWKAVKKTEEAQIPAREWLSKTQHQDFFDLGEEVPDAGDVVEGNVLPSAASVDESLPEVESAPSVRSGDDMPPIIEPSTDPIDGS